MDNNVAYLHIVASMSSLHKELDGSSINLSKCLKEV